jgi:hypothetical protein
MSNQWEVVKKVKNATLYANGLIKIDNVRGSYVHVDKPYKGKNDGPTSIAKYSTVGIMPKATHAEAKDLIIEAINKLLAENKNAKVAKDKRFIQNGDDKEKEEYANSYIVSAREEKKPKCRDRNGELVEELEEIREVFQSGYWFNILIRPWYQDNDFGKRVNAGLVGIQFVKKDKTFGEASIDETNAWDRVDGDDDGDGMGAAEPGGDDL